MTVQPDFCQTCSETSLVFITRWLIFILSDAKSKDETIALLKETLGEQENMLQMQEDYINKKEEELNSGKQGMHELPIFSCSTYFTYLI